MIKVPLSQVIPRYKVPSQSHLNLPLTTLHFPLCLQGFGEQTLESEKINVMVLVKPIRKMGDLFLRHKCYGWQFES